MARNMIYDIAKSMGIDFYVVQDDDTKTYQIKKYGKYQRTAKENDVKYVFSAIEEFMKSVKEVVDTCIYSTPTIANFISRKKPETIINYQKMLDLTDKFGELIWDSYEKVQVNGRTFWREKR